MSRSHQGRWKTAARRAKSAGGPGVLEVLPPTAAEIRRIRELHHYWQTERGITYRLTPRRFWLALVLVRHTFTPEELPGIVDCAPRSAIAEHAKAGQGPLEDLSYLFIDAEMVEQWLLALGPRAARLVCGGPGWMLGSSR